MCWPWKCENIFCTFIDICSNFTNCENCKERVLFLDMVFENQKPEDTVWGNKLIKILKEE
jgi:hypothetical protein